MESVDLRNIRFTIYDKETGRIVRTGMAGNVWSLNWRVEHGQGVVFDEQGDGATHKVTLIDGIPTIVPRAGVEPIEG